MMRTWSWILGFIGGLGLLGFLVYAAFVDSIEPGFAAAGGVSLVMVAAWLIIDREGVEQALRARGARYTATSALLVVVALAIAVALNVLAVRYDDRLDLTASKRFALSDQTKKVLAGLQSEVQVLAFFPTGSPERSSFEDLVKGYEAEGSTLKLSFHDPVREPMLAEQHKITSSWGTVVLLSGANEQRLESDFGEEALTNAIIRLSTGTQHQLCVVTGHAELDPEDQHDATGMGVAMGRLTAQNYLVRTVNLVREAGVPADCNLVLLADPQSDPFPAEREHLAAYVAGGGSLIVMLDPTHAPELARDLDRYGIKVGDDIVIEQNPRYQLMGGDPTWLVLDDSSFAPHPMLEGGVGMVLLRVARSVGQGSERPGLQVQVLARSTAAGWAETSLDGITTPAPDGLDIIGSVPLIAVAEVVDPAGLAVGARSMGEATLPGSEPVAEAEVVREAGGRVLVIGDSDFAANELVQQGNNQDLLLNAVAWMLGEDDQISIRPNPAATGSLSMSLLQGLGVWLICLLAVPGLAIGMALGTWRSRRRL